MQMLVSVFKLALVGLQLQAVLLDPNPTRVDRNVQLISIGPELGPTEHENTAHLFFIVFRWERIIGCWLNRLEAKQR